MTEPVGADWLDQPVRITRDGVYFGEHKLPGLLAEDGVTLKPAIFAGINQLTVTFLVGDVAVDDPYVTDTPTDDGVQFSSHPPIEANG